MRPWSVHVDTGKQESCRLAMQAACMQHYVRSAALCAQRPLHAVEVGNI